MRIEELINDGKAMDAIKVFVNNPYFSDWKDAFICSTPRGGMDGTQIIMNSGKVDGVLHVFNKMENLVKAKPKTEPTKREGQDPDLKDD